MYWRYKTLNIKNFIIILTCHILAYIKISKQFLTSVLCFM
jgi:hypothetical protein